MYGYFWDDKRIYLILECVPPSNVYTPCPSSLHHHSTKLTINKIPQRQHHNCHQVRAPRGAVQAPDEPRPLYGAAVRAGLWAIID